MHGVSYMIVYTIDDNDHVLCLNNAGITNRYDLPDPFYIWCWKCNKSIEFNRSDIIVGNSVNLISFIILVFVTYVISGIVFDKGLAIILIHECVVILLLAFIYFRDKSRISVFLNIQ